MPSNPFSNRSAPRRSVKRSSSGLRGRATGAPSRVRLMGAEEKRQLILAHAASRQPLDRLQVFSLWAGILVCALTVAAGWAYTAHRQVVHAVWQGNVLAQEASDVLETEALQEELGRVQQEWGSALQQAVQRLDQMKAEQDQDTVGAVAEKIRAHATSSAGDLGLFQAPTPIPSNLKGLQIEE